MGPGRGTSHEAGLPSRRGILCAVQDTPIDIQSILSAFGGEARLFPLPNLVLFPDGFAPLVGDAPAVPLNRNVPWSIGNDAIGSEYVSLARVLLRSGHRPADARRALERARAVETRPDHVRWIDERLESIEGGFVP